MTMQTEKGIGFTCAYYTLETTVSAAVSEPQPTHRKGIAVMYHREHSKQPNKLKIPANLDV
jgi:hypothetical protein